MTGHYEVTLNGENCHVVAKCDSVLPAHITVIQITCDIASRCILYSLYKLGTCDT